MAQRETAFGKCKWFNSKKGFGFITLESGEEVFVHQTEIHASGFRSLAEGETVECQIITCENSQKRKAVKVTGPNGDFVQGDNRMGSGSGYDGGYERRGGGGGERGYGGGNYQGGGGGGGYANGGGYNGGGGYSGSAGYPGGGYHNQGGYSGGGGGRGGYSGEAY